MSVERGLHTSHTDLRRSLMSAHTRGQTLSQVFSLVLSKTSVWLKSGSLMCSQFERRGGIDLSLRKYLLFIFSFYNCTATGRTKQAIWRCSIGLCTNNLFKNNHLYFQDTKVWRSDWYYTWIHLFKTSFWRNLRVDWQKLNSIKRTRTVTEITVTLDTAQKQKIPT